MKVDEMQAAVEAILFASGEPIEYQRIAEALEIEPEYAENLLTNLGDSLDERGSGICLVRMDDEFQLCTRSEYADKVRAVLEIRKIPLSQMQRLRCWRLLHITSPLQNLLLSRSGEWIAPALWQPFAKRDLLKKKDVLIYPADRFFTAQHRSS